MYCLDKLKEKLKEDKVDAFLITNEINIRYVTGFTGSESILLITQKNDYLFTDFRYLEQAQRDVPWIRIIERKVSLIKTICKKLKQLNIKKLYIESLYVTFNQYSEIKNNVKGIRFIPTQGIIEKHRKRKTQEEIKIIQTAIDIAERAYSNIRKKIKAGLENATPVRKMSLTDEELLIIKHLNLLTAKPVIYLFNVSEEQLQDSKQTEQTATAILHNVGENTNFILINAQLENEVLALSEDEQKEYLSQFHLTETGLNRLITKAYETLGLISLLTAGEKETRAWTIKRGTTAVDCSGVIHTDFVKKFIKADVLSFDDFVACGGWVKAREQGKVRSMGRDYVMQDGDVVEFKIGA